MEWPNVRFVSTVEANGRRLGVLLVQHSCTTNCIIIISNIIVVVVVVIIF